MVRIVVFTRLNCYPALLNKGADYICASCHGQRSLTPGQINRGVGRRVAIDCVQVPGAGNLHVDDVSAGSYSKRLAAAVNIIVRWVSIV